MSSDIGDELLDAGIQNAIRLLSKYSEFHPFGVAVDTSGELRIVMAHEGAERPAADDAMRATVRSLRIGVEEGTYIATAVASDIRLTDTETGVETDAIRVDIEVGKAVSTTCYLPYALDSQVVVPGELIAVEGQRQVFI